MAGSLWRRAMLFLGLGPDDEYEDYDGQQQIDPELRGAAARPASPNRAPVAEQQEYTGIVRTLPAPGIDTPSVIPRPRTQSVVRTISAPVSTKPHVVIPTTFNSGQEVAEKFKDGQPVILNLTTVDRALARRLIDFASGVCYVMDGTMEKVANDVFLMSPSNVEVPPEEKRRF